MELPGLDVLVRMVEQDMPNFDVVKAWSEFGLQARELDYLESDKSKYYKAIQAFGRLFGGKFCDLGTWWGLSACAAYGVFEQIDTFEIDERQILNIDELKKRCNLTIFSNAEQCLQIDYSPYSLVFVDVSAEPPYKDGEMERLVHERLRETFRGIAMYDDIDLSDGVMKFWNSVENHKISLPDWHNSTWHDRFVRPGFGIVDYRE